MRLTNDIRGAICSAAIARAFAKEDAALLVTEHALADEVYACAVTPAMEKGLEAFGTALAAATLAYDKDSPTRAMCQTNNWPKLLPSVSVDGPNISSAMLSLPKARYGPQWGANAFLGAEHPLTERVEDSNRAKAALREIKGGRAAEVMAVLSQAFNVAKLEIIWPEIMPLARPILANFGMQVKVQLPAVLMAPLNAALDLPIEEKELEAA